MRFIRGAAHTTSEKNMKPKLIKLFFFFTAPWANIEQHALFLPPGQQEPPDLQSEQQKKNMHSISSKEFNIPHRLKSHKSPRRNLEVIAMAATRLRSAFKASTDTGTLLLTPPGIGRIIYID